MCGVINIKCVPYARNVQLDLRGQKDNWYCRHRPKIAINCWEKPGEDCHRRLVAEWLEKHLSTKIPEF